MIKIALNQILPLTGGYVACARNIASGSVQAGRERINMFVPEADDIAVLVSGKKTCGFALISEAPYGEAVSLVASDANTSVITITGIDFLGQKMVEKITLTGTTAVAGKKAFKAIHSITRADADTVGVTLGGMIALGVPHQVASVELVLKNGAAVANPTVTTMTTAQTATSNDPRGTISIAGFTAGDELEVFCMVSDYCVKDATTGADKKGGLYGVPHYAG